MDDPCDAHETYLFMPTKSIYMVNELVSEPHISKPWTHSPPIAQLVAQVSTFYVKWFVRLSWILLGIQWEPEILFLGYHLPTRKIIT